MKLVLFQKPGADDVLPGVLTERGVVGIADDTPSSYTPQLTMQGIIDHFDACGRPWSGAPAMATLSPCPLSDCARPCRVRGRFSPVSPTTGSTGLWRRGRSTCS